ncbi:MAG: hypothetical protein A2X81_13925 [Desulfobacterales bacterium GWB2_56_26]|nr:MAG: hypothetical protein A2X81_13925 [Desulfobacterales bacterium GWB2_56_26]
MEMATSLHRGLSAFLILLFTITLIVYFAFIRESYKPLHRLAPGDIPKIADDLDTESLIQCVRRQIASLKKQDPAKTILLDSDIYDNRWLLHSQEEFLAKLMERPDSGELERFLHDKFIFYQAGGRKDKRGRKMLVTGYYEPVFDGSLTAEPPFVTPLYALPKSLVTVPSQEGKAAQIGRYDESNTLTPFWNREEIETAGLLAGEELVFLKDPLDAFLLHVQGSGKIRLPDQSILSVRFAGSNGLEYKSIGKLLVDEQKMALEEVTVPAIRAYLERHPEERQRILHHNPRFIFFTWGDSLGPRGSSGEVLTPGRSIAIDGSALPEGTLGYLVSRKPTLGGDGRISDWKTMHRFVFPQDSGAAIKGTGRVDVFFGQGEYAEVAANHMKEPGKLYFLVKKGYPGP